MGLSTNTTLQSIDVSGNSGCFANEDNVKALSSCLVSNTTLRRVDVSSCHLGTDGIQYLAQHCLPFCGDRLKSLILFREGCEEDTDRCLEDSAVEMVANGLRCNTNLENLGHLRRSNNCDYVQHLLHSNRGGRRSLQSDDTLPLAAWSHVLARAGTIQYDDDDESNDSLSLASSSSSNDTTASASVVFELLRGPAMLVQRPQS